MVFSRKYVTLYASIVKIDTPKNILWIEIGFQIDVSCSVIYGFESFSCPKLEYKYFGAKQNSKIEQKLLFYA